MNRHNFQMKHVALLGGTLVVVGALASCQVEPPQVEPTVEVPPPERTVEVPQLRELPSPGESPVGLAWDGARLWVADEEANQLFLVDLTTGDPAPWDVSHGAGRIGGVAWDGESLWVLDAEAAVILRLDPETGEERGAIDAPRPQIEGDWSYGGMTHAGACLWVAISAGWCSSLNCVDPDSGEIVESFFPQCDPRGLASDGTYLWIVAYNGPELPSRLDRRRLSDRVEEIIQSQEFLFDLQLADPTALAYVDGALWVADRAERRIFQVDLR